MVSIGVGGEDEEELYGLRSPQGMVEYLGTTL